MTDLESLGWTSFFTDNLAPCDGLVPARVIRDGRRLLAAGEAGVRELFVPASVAVAGRLAVGDWVLVDPASDGAWRVERRLPRRTVLARRAAGTATAEQVLAANVDLVLVVLPLDRPFHAARVERAVSVAWSSGAQPVVLLTKSDLCADAAAAAGEAGSAAPGVPVFLLAVPLGSGLEDVRALLAPGRTAVLLGPSGAGKSTLVNALAGSALRTAAVRSDGRGRHTTTERELIALPGGGALIDGPGIRELGVWDAEDGIARTFADIEELAAGCRFSDCGHDGEPGCAVAAAVAAGTLPAARLASFHKLQRELHWQRARADGSARLEEARRWKAIHKSMRHFSKG